MRHWQVFHIALPLYAAKGFCVCTDGENWQCGDCMTSVLNGNAVENMFFFLFSRVVLSTKIRIVDNYIIIISKLYPFTYFGIYKSLPLEYLSLTFLDEGISRQALCSHTIYKVVSLSLSGLLDLIREKHF